MRWLRKYFYAILLGTKALLLALAYTKGQKDANEKRAGRDARDYNDTRKRIDQVTRDGDVESQREWLSERGRK
jgi:hypothetical protein